MARLWKLAILIGLAILVFVVIPRSSWGRSFLPTSFDDFQQQVSSYAPYDRVAYVCLYVVGTLLFVPGTILSFAGATLFGTIWGTLLTWLGAVIGSTVCFLVVRLLGRDAMTGVVQRLFGGRFEAFDQWIKTNGFQAMLIVRLLPIFPFNGVNLGAALTGIPMSSYVAATALGILPGTFVYQYLFAHLGQAVLKEGLKLEQLADPQLWIPVALFILFVLLGRWATRRIGLPQDAPR